jgi:hypothetical protein
MAEREATDPTWTTLCKSLGVLLAWAENLPERVRRGSQ